MGSLKYLDMARDTGIDTMQCCLLGVTCRLLSLMLDSKFHGKPFYIEKLTSLLDHRLLAIKPVNEISRTTRALTDRKHWEASEFRSLSYITLYHYCMI